MRRLFLLVPLSALVTGFAYYLFEHVFWIPKYPSGTDVFLSPRWYGQMNALPSGTFNQWSALAWALPLLIGVVCAAYVVGVKRRLEFRVYLVLVYVLGLVVAATFLFLTPQGLSHLSAQVQSSNDPIWSTVRVLHAAPEYPLAAEWTRAIKQGFISANPIGKMQFVFRALYSNTAGYTLGGTTHPPGFALIFLVIYQAAMTLSGSTSVGVVAVYFGVIVTMLNFLVLPLVMLIARDVFSETTARWTGIFMLTVPSVAMHLCSVSEGLGSVFTAAALFLTAREVKRLASSDAAPGRGHDVACGLGAGLAMTLAAQITYGHAFVIVAIILAFVAATWQRDRRRLLAFSAGVVAPALVYFGFEYRISAGASFWPIRALSMATSVGSGLSAFRPLATSQFANFVIMSVMGGVLFLPVLIYSVGYVVRIVLELRRSTPRAVSPPAVRTFVVLVTFVLLVLLGTQTSVRLEVERTWHWFFIPVWSLMGVFLAAAGPALERVWSDEPSPSVRRLAPLALCLAQLAITVALAMSIQDYY
jgi:hypothetical protein